MTDTSLTLMPTRTANPHLNAHKLSELRELLDNRLLVERSRADQTLAAVNDFSTSYSPEDRELARIVLERGNEQVSLLERAVERMDNGTYGCCVSCNRPISVDWLATMPEVRHCVGCMRIG